MPRWAWPVLVAALALYAAFVLALVYVFLVRNRAGDRPDRTGR